MPLAEYLAQNYLTPDSKEDRKSRKPKRKNGVGLVIADDNALGWTRDGANNAEDDRPLTGKLQ